MTWKDCPKGSCHRHEKCMYFKHTLCPERFRPTEGTEEQPWAEPMPETPMVSPD